MTEQDEPTNNIEQVELVEQDEPTNLVLYCDQEAIIIKDQKDKGECYLDVDPEFVDKLSFTFDDDDLFPYKNTHIYYDYIIHDQEYIDENIKWRESHNLGQCREYCDCDVYKNTDEKKWLERLNGELGICLSVNGSEFYTRKSTLMKSEYFKSLFNGCWTVETNLNEDPKEFIQLLKCLRGHTADPGPLGKKYMIEGGPTIYHSCKNIVEWANEPIDIISPGVVLQEPFKYEESLTAQKMTGNSHFTLWNDWKAEFNIKLDYPYKFSVQDFKIITNRKIKRIQIEFGEFSIFCEDAHHFIDYNLYMVQPIYNHQIGKENNRGDTITPNKVTVKVECIEKGPSPLWVQLIYTYCPKSLIKGSFWNNHIIWQEDLLKSTIDFSNTSNFSKISRPPKKTQSLIYSRYNYKPLTRNGPEKGIFGIWDPDFTYTEFQVAGEEPLKSLRPVKIILLRSSSKPFYVVFKDKNGKIIKAINFYRIGMPDLLTPPNNQVSFLLSVEDYYNYRIETSEPVHMWIEVQNIIEIY